MASIISIIILAAGKSTRLGRQKQLLKWGASTLLNHVIEQANGSEADKVLVVVDSDQKEISGSIELGRARIAYVENGPRVMSKTIAKGMNRSINSDAVILATCDQPFVNSQLFNSLIERFRSGQELVACKYESKSIGIPSLFSKQHYGKLKAIVGDSGAKEILLQSNNLELASFPLGDLDVDTEEDYQACLKQQSMLERQP